MRKMLLIAVGLTCLSVVAAVDLTTATIVVPDSPAVGESQAATDLALSFHEMTGRDYPIIHESLDAGCGAKVYLGRTKRAREEGIAAEKLSAQSFRWLTRGEVLFIVGGSPSGTEFGVYRLLGKFFDCYQLDYDVRSACKLRALKVPNLDEVKSPMIRKRFIHTWNRAKWMTPEYAVAKTNVLRRNFLLIADEDLNEPGLRYTKRLPYEGHTYFEYVPPKKWGAVHPEWFAVNEDGVRDLGKGDGGQLCLTNPEMRREACRHITEIASADMALPENERPNYYDLSQRDSCFTHICWCTNCLARSKELGGDSALNLEFVNEVARALAKVNQNAVLKTFAYECTEKPQSTVKPEKNVQVEYCDYYANRCDLQPLTNAVNATQYQLFMGWVNSGCQMSLWQYCLPRYSHPQMEGGYGVPGVAIDAIIADTELYRRCGLKGVFFQSDYPGFMPRSFQFLQYFLAAQLFFDRDTDPERLIKIYMRDVYGPAAREMWKYLKLLREVQRRNPISSVEDWQYRRFKHIEEPGFVEQALALLREAEVKVSGDRLRTGKVAVELADVIHGAILSGLVQDRSSSIVEFERQTRLHFKALPYGAEKLAALEKLLSSELDNLRK